ncbi:MAG TPA: hypothetical protein VFU49_12950, partial [Ktedonobacteraceae bacterium]|nr:hypothetical protein [Ktedonobacteraceae bacterium]
MANALPHERVRLIFDATELRYDFGPQHPLQPGRLEALIDLLAVSGLWRAEQAETRLDFRPATINELSLVHTPDYITAVQQLSQPEAEITGEKALRERVALALKYGFGDGDTPPLPGMHGVSARIAGGTLVAMSAVMGLPEGGAFEHEE